MKAKRFLLALFTLLTCIQAWSEDCDVFTEKINGYDVSFEVISETDRTCMIYDCDENISGNVIIPGYVYGNKYEVVKIDGSAFENCAKITSITIPKEVINIYSSDSFSGCIGLTSIIVDDGNPVYDSRNGCNAIISSNNSLILGCSGTTIPNSVKYIGSGAFKGQSGLTSIEIPKSVTSIGQEAFYGCTGLTSIEIPNSVTRIEQYAFRGCTGLTSIDIPNSVTSIKESTFSNCTGLTSVTIPNSVTSIEGYAFSNCTGLASVTVPNSVTWIGTGAFSGCTSLTSVTVETRIPIGIDYWTFMNRANATLYVPAGSKAAYEATDYWKEFGTIVEYGNIPFADANVKALCVANWDTSGDGELSVDEAAAVTDLGEVFRGNSHITSFNELQNFTGLTNIGIGAFSNTVNLASVVFPNSITSIEQYAFAYCRKLTSITIPSSVTSIATWAFQDCSGLSTIIVDEANTTFDSRDNCNAIIKTSINQLYLGCKNTVIPNTVTSIGSSPAFQNCSDLTTITIPNNLATIGSSAFSGCSNLTGVIVERLSPLSITLQIFPNLANATLYVPIGSKAAYEAADYWKEFGTIVEYGNISFADANVKAICIANWDTDGDRELSVDEAAAVTELGEVFRNNKNITSFNELQYFTGLSNISNEAFNGCSNLTSVIIPCSVNSIGAGAFYGAGLTDIIIPSSVTTIGESAFKHTALNSVSFPNSVTSVGNGIFYDTNLTQPVFNLTVFAYMPQSYQGEYSIPIGIKNVGSGSFAGCANMTSVTIPNSVTSIDDRAFGGCTGLTSVTIPNSVTIICSRTFLGCI